MNSEAPRLCPTCDARFYEREARCPHDGEILIAFEDDELAAGAVIDGRFEIVRTLGQGGICRVYLARQLTVQREVALKVLLHRHASREDFIKRFSREARAVASLRHPNTVQVFDFGQTRDGLMYIVMEYLEGRTLAALLEEEGPLPLERAAHILAQVCDSLSEAHGADIVHRDLKPENIFVCVMEGQPDLVKVLDFGLARLAQAADESRITKVGAITGTPGYIAPEVVLGKRATPQSDLYALGVLLYEMLAGRMPFESSSPVALLMKTTTEEPPGLPSSSPCDASVNAFVTRALAREPEARLASARAFKEALMALAQAASPAISPRGSTTCDAPRDGLEEGVAVRRAGAHAASTWLEPIQVELPALEPTHPSPSRPWTQRYRTFLFGFALLVAAGVGMVTLGPSQRDAPEPPAPGADATVHIQPEHGVYPLGLHLEVLEDPSGEWGIDEVTSAPLVERFERSQEVTPNFGHSSSAYWVRFRWDPGADARASWLLESSYPLTDRIDAWFEEPGGGWEHRQVGDRVPFDEREVDHRAFLFLLDNAGQPQQVYLRYESRGARIRVPLTLWSQQAFLEAELVAEMNHGLFFGLMLVMIVYNFFIFITLRDVLYLYYVLYVACMTALRAIWDGVAFQHIFPQWPVLNNEGLLVCAALTGAFLLLFSRHFLKVREFYPTWDRLARGLQVLFGALAPLIFILPYRVSAQLLAALSGLISFPLLIVIGVLVMRRGYEPAQYYVLAWSGLLFGGVSMGLIEFGVLPVNDLTSHSLAIGTALEVVLLSFALAHRINVLKQEKDAAAQMTLRVQRQATEMLQSEVEHKTHELRVRNAQLRDLNRQKTSFFQNISHELRTPLTLLVGPLETLVYERRDDFDAATLQQHRIMLRNARRLLRLINQLLDLSRLEAGRMQLWARRGDVIDTVRQVCESFRSMAIHKHIACRFDADVPSGVLYYDADKLETVVYNLLSNAFKFTPEGGTIRVFFEQPSKSWLTINVSDTGVGIAPEDQTHIFDRFRQASEGASERCVEGTGIGLALAKELVELHHGRLEVESQPGEGTTFSVWLRGGRRHLQPHELLDSQDAPADDSASSRGGASPIALATPSEPVDVDLPPGAERPSSASFGGEDDALDALDAPPEIAFEATSEFVDATVELRRHAEARRAPSRLLIVDDNGDMRAFIRAVFSGHSVVEEAADGLEALERAREVSPDLIIADVMMPRMDGFELCRALREDEALQSIPVILLTARASDAHRLEGLEAGAADYLAKPFSPQELRLRVSNLLQIRAQTHQLAALNETLRAKVDAQLQALLRSERLARYLPPHLVDQALADDASELTRRRQRVTLVLTGLGDLDALHDANEPEIVTECLNLFLDALGQLVDAHEGVLAQVDAERAMILFGAAAPRSPAAQARAALRFTLDLLRLMASLADRWRALGVQGAPTLRVAVHQSYVTLGSFGSAHRTIYTAVGAAVRDARALEAHCPPGRALVTESVRALTDAHVRYRRAEVTLQSGARTLTAVELDPSESDVAGASVARAS